MNKDSISEGPSSLKSTPARTKTQRVMTWIWTHKMVSFLLLIILFGGLWSWKSIHSQQKEFEQSSLQMEANFQDSLLELKQENMQLVATTFSWAIRSELIRNNHEQISLFFADFVHTPQVLSLQLVHPETGRIELSTDQKHVGELFPHHQKITKQVVISDSSHFQVLTPISGLNKNLGVFVLTAQF